MVTAFLLNPPRRRTKHRKARRSKARARRSGARHSRRTRRSRRSRTTRASRRSNKRGWFKSRGGRKYGRRGVRRRISGHRRYSRPTKKTYLARASNPPRRRRRGGYRRNPGGSIGGFKLSVPEVIPFRLPIPGFIGDLGNGIIQGAAAGAVVFTGYVVSGKVVDFVEGTVLGNKNYLGAWQRPLLFATIAGATGGLVAMVAPKSKKAMWALLAASGPGIRAFAGIVNALIPAGQTGIMADVKNAAGGLADYLQVGAYYEAGMGDTVEGGWGDEGEVGMEDYLQVGAMYEAGLGEEQEVVGF